MKSEIAFEASIWHQREKEKELSDKECKLETLQNQTLKAEMYTSSLHVHLNMLQDKINNHMQKIKQACELIRAHLMKINHIISRFFIIKKVMLLNNLIQEDVKIQSRCKQLVFAVMTSTSNSIAIAQYHKSQWKQQWKKYRKCIADVHIYSTRW